jgi:hypothetical protein
MFIANAFSLSMLPWTETADQFAFKATELSLSGVQEMATFTKFHSIVGHEDTAKLFSSMIGVEIPVNRTSVQLDPRDKLIVGQYSGRRLLEGVTELPESASIRWVLVEFINP